MVAILSEGLPRWSVLTLEDFPGAPEPEETGSTYAENARIKAESAARHTGELCIADDAGLEIDAIPGELGVHSKRFQGPETSFDTKMRVILEEMSQTPPEGRGARFVCHVALSGPGRETVAFDATCEGVIAREPLGSGGFGYDPIFFLPSMGCTMAQLSAEQKHSVSHRGKVLRAVIGHLCGQRVP